MQLLPVSQIEDPSEPDGDLAGLQWEMKRLKPKHLQVASLLAQGFKNVDIAAMVGITPEYVSMLLRQPLMQAEISRISEIAGVRLEALFEQGVDVIADVMQNGGNADKLKAVRLQLEATKRIGRPDPNAGSTATNVDRLEKLAERLIGLQSGIRKGGLFNEDGQEISEG